MTEPPIDKVQSSVVGPLAERLESEPLPVDVASAIENRLSDLQGNVYEILEEWLHNETNINELRYLFRVGSKIHLAYCKAAAGAAETITCYLDADATGEEILVNCDTNSGGNLNVSVPLLKDGQLLYVVKIGDDWYAFEKFNTGQTAIAYVKTTPGAVTSVACWFSESDGSGVEIAVPCEIAGGGNLNEAIPRLSDGMLIGVIKNGATWGTELFQGKEDCDCYTAP